VLLVEQYLDFYWELAVVMYIIDLERSEVRRMLTV